MDFMRLLKSLEELLYEAMVMLVFLLMSRLDGNVSTT